MIKLLITADDFTGALDTGVQFAKHGISAVVALYNDFDHRIIEEIDVLVIDTESRHCLPAAAANRVYEAVVKAKDLGVGFFYKKTDSTLRGNIGSELKALKDASGEACLAFVPSFPRAGRTTENGIQYVNGIPVHKTTFAIDSQNPVRDSFIPKIISEQSDMNVGVISTDYAKKINEKKLQSTDLLVFDSQTEEDLKNVAEALYKSKLTSALAGCAGFAEYLPELAGIKKSVNTEKMKFGRNALTICGSINEASLEQMRFAKECGYPMITLSCEEILNNEYFETERGSKLIEQIVSGLNSYGRLALRTAESREEAGICKDAAASYGIPPEELYNTINKNVGQLVRTLMEKADIDTLVIFGGDTAMGVMNALGCNFLIPREEILPGVAVSEVRGFKSGLKLISKAGGFGSNETLIQIAEYIEGSK